MSLAEQLKVLIVDDTTTSRMLIRDGLQEIGIKNISFASDGEQGLKHVMSTQTHLVISDFNMPKLDGLGCCAPSGRTGRRRRRLSSC
ncbi:MAG: response regulator [Hyphomicrobium sp.]